MGSSGGSFPTTNGPIGKPAALVIMEEFAGNRVKQSQRAGRGYPPPAEPGTRSGGVHEITLLGPFRCHVPLGFLAGGVGPGPESQPRRLPAALHRLRKVGGRLDGGLLAVGDGNSSRSTSVFGQRRGPVPPRPARSGLPADREPSRTSPPREDLHHSLWKGDPHPLDDLHVLGARRLRP